MNLTLPGSPPHDFHDLPSFDRAAKKFFQSFCDDSQSVTIQPDEAPLDEHYRPFGVKELSWTVGLSKCELSAWYLNKCLHNSSSRKMRALDS